jgi:hypothetical protein
MADASKTIDGKLVVLSIATNITTPVYKSVVCKIDNGLSGRQM